MLYNWNGSKTVKIYRSENMEIHNYSLINCPCYHFSAHFICIFTSYFAVQILYAFYTLFKKKKLKNSLTNTPTTKFTEKKRHYFLSITLSLCICTYLVSIIRSCNAVFLLFCHLLSFVYYSWSSSSSVQTLSS